MILVSRGLLVSSVGILREVQAWLDRPSEIARQWFQAQCPMPSGPISTRKQLPRQIGFVLRDKGVMAGFADSTQQQLLRLFDEGQYRAVLKRAQSLTYVLGGPFRPDCCRSTVQLGEFAKAAQLLEPHQAALDADGSFYLCMERLVGGWVNLTTAKDLLSRALALEPKSPQIRNNLPAY